MTEDRVDDRAIEVAGLLRTLHEEEPELKTGEIEPGDYVWIVKTATVYIRRKDVKQTQRIPGRVLKVEAKSALVQFLGPVHQLCKRGDTYGRYAENHSLSELEHRLPFDDPLEL